MTTPVFALFLMKTPSFLLLEVRRSRASLQAGSRRGQFPCRRHRGADACSDSTTHGASQKCFLFSQSVKILFLKLINLSHLLAVFQGHGYTSEQSAQALNAHKSVKKALHFLRNLNHQPGEFSRNKVTLRRDKTLASTRFSAALSANVSSSLSPKPRNAAESAVRDKRSPPASQK